MLRTAIWSAGFWLLITICGPAVHAQSVGSVINAASCNTSDVQTALNSVKQATATVVIPSGTCTWTSPLTYTVPSAVTKLTIQGQTTVSCTGTHGTASYACTATDNTILVDSDINGGEAIWSIHTGTAAVRITGITFQGGNAVAGGKSNGFITLSGSSTALRMDHCHVNATTYTIFNHGGGLTIFSPMNGVFDHNLFTLQGQENGIRSYPENYGDTAWSQPTNFGTSNFIFIEDNVFFGGFVNDCNNGGRQVVRYNTHGPTPNETSGDSGGIQTHTVGQGTTRARGCRAIERYHNYAYNPTPSFSEFTAGDNNSGPGIIFGDTVSTGFQYGWSIQIGGRVLSGNNCGAGPGNAGGCPAPAASFGYCGTGSTGVGSVWDANNIAETGYPCLGQSGRGQGDLLNGAAFPSTLNTVTGTTAWPHELLEPIYVWNETVGSGNVIVAQIWNGVQAKANRDYYSQVSTSANTSPTSPFNGATGTGFGTLANRPTTCTAGSGGPYGISPIGSYGVGYFATDVNSGQGELYVCTSTNTWTAVYKPFTYPHPLTAAGTSVTSGNAPNPPSNLNTSVQ